MPLSVYIRRDDYLSTFSMNLVNGLDGVQVVNTGVKTNFVHNDNSNITSSLVKGTHLGRDIAGGDNMGLGFDGSLDYSDMVSVWNQRNDEAVYSNGSFELSRVGSIQ